MLQISLDFFEFLLRSQRLIYSGAEAFLVRLQIRFRNAVKNRHQPR